MSLRAPVSFTVAVLLVAVAWNLIGNLVLPGAWYVPANLVVAAGLVLGARAAGLGSDELGLDRERLGSGLRWGGAAMAVVGAAVVALVAVPASRSFFEDGAVADAASAERWFTALVRIPLGTALFEEVLFRGVLLAALLRWLSSARALLANAALFGVWHVVPAWESAEGSAWAQVGAVLGTVIVTTIAGGLFVWLRLRSGSVVAPVLAHTATNSFAYLGAVAALEWGTA
jgi:membrane protease YdiL (CAAX protease family)